MSESFATLNADLLQLCLSHVENGTDAARAGATCKHWRAVASTERLWRELCPAGSKARAVYAERVRPQ